MRCFQNILFLISAVLCFTSIADTYTFPNGRILEDPYVISRRPDGLEIGHKNGIIFVKFEDLPEQVRKKYNYDPAKAAEFEAQQQAYKEKLRAEKQKRDAEEAAARAENQKIMFRWQVDKLELEIVKTEARINFLKSEISRLDKEYENCLNKSIDLAGKTLPANSNYGGNSYSYGWNGGFVTTGGGTYISSTVRRMISSLGDDASSAKFKANSYRNELESKQVDLIVMKKNYAALKSQQK